MAVEAGAWLGNTNFAGTTMECLPGNLLTTKPVAAGGYNSKRTVGVFDYYFGKIGWSRIY